MSSRDRWVENLRCPQCEKTGASSFATSEIAASRAVALLLERFQPSVPWGRMVAMITSRAHVAAFAVDPSVFPVVPVALGSGRHNFETPNPAAGIVACGWVCGVGLGLST
jgi:hypothetical protein